MLINTLLTLLFIFLIYMYAFVAGVMYIYIRATENERINTNPDNIEHVFNKYNFNNAFLFFCILQFLIYALIGQ